MDPDGGYTPAQIDLLDLTVRYYTKASDLRVHRFTLADVVSLAPLDEFFHPISWKVGTGLFSRLVPQGRSNDLAEAYVWRSSGGAGLACEPWMHAVAYAFADATVDYGPALTDDYAIGPGASAGLFVGPAGDRWKAHLFAAVTRFALGDHSTASAFGVEARITLTPRMGITLGVSGNRDFEQNWIEAGASWNVYF